MPIGKGFVFASECLEDIQNTRKFINHLALSGKEWESKQDYIPTEPIGEFALDNE